MARYENNQRIVGFVRRLPAEFGGFNSQNVPMSGQMVQLLHGQMKYKGLRIFIALFTRPGENFDSVVLSIPLFHIPDQGLEELYEQLLSWNNGATETVHFAVDEPLNTINLVCMRPVEGMAFQEFSYCSDNLITVRLNASDRLQREFGLIRIGG